MTANQVVAYNVAQARAIRGWAQEEAAQALAPYLGKKWSVASFSAVERSVAGGRIRRFSADQLLALSRGFDLPIGFFLVPPPPGNQIRLRTAASDDEHPGVLLDAVFGTQRGGVGAGGSPTPRHGPRSRQRALPGARVPSGAHEDAVG